jgi:hypothetical protein
LSHLRRGRSLSYFNDAAIRAEFNFNRLNVLQQDTHTHQAAQITLQHRSRKLNSQKYYRVKFHNDKVAAFNTFVYRDAQFKANT